MRRVLVHIFICISAVVLGQGSPQYSQYMFNEASINPAFVGSEEALIANALYKNQWNKLKNSPESKSLTIHSPIRNKNIAAGLSLFNDKMNVSTYNEILGMYAYKIHLHKMQISLGLQGGVAIFKNQYSTVKTIESGDESFAADYTKTSPKVGVGIHLKYNKHYVGFSIPNLIRPESTNTISYYENPIYLLAGTKLNVNNDLVFNPSVLLKKQLGYFFQFDINSLFTYQQKYTAGLSYRNPTGIVFLMQYKITNQFDFGYSYDYLIGPVGSYFSGAHEFLIRYNFVITAEATDPKSFR